MSSPKRPTRAAAVRASTAIARVAEYADDSDHDEDDGGPRGGRRSPHQKQRRSSVVANKSKDSDDDEYAPTSDVDGVEDDEYAPAASGGGGGAAPVYPPFALRDEDEPPAFDAEATPDGAFVSAHQQQNLYRQTLKDVPLRAGGALALPQVAPALLPAVEDVERTLRALLGARDSTGRLLVPTGVVWAQALDLYGKPKATQDVVQFAMRVRVTKRGAYAMDAALASLYETGHPCFALLRPTHSPQSQDRCRLSPPRSRHGKRRHSRLARRRHCHPGPTPQAVSPGPEGRLSRAAPGRAAAEGARRCEPQPSPRAQPQQLAWAQASQQGQCVTRAPGGAALAELRVLLATCCVLVVVATAVSALVPLLTTQRVCKRVNGRLRGSGGRCRLLLLLQLVLQQLQLLGRQLCGRRRSGGGSRLGGSQANQCAQPRQPGISGGGRRRRRSARRRWRGTQSGRHCKVHVWRRPRGGCSTGGGRLATGRLCCRRPQSQDRTEASKAAV